MHMCNVYWIWTGGLISQLAQYVEWSDNNLDYLWENARNRKTAYHYTVSYFVIRVRFSDRPAKKFSFCAKNWNLDPRNKLHTITHFHAGSFTVYTGDHLPLGIIWGPIWGSFPVLGSFAVGDHLHLRLLPAVSCFPKFCCYRADTRQNCWWQLERCFLECSHLCLSVLNVLCHSATSCLICTFPWVTEGLWAMVQEFLQ